MSPAAKSSCTMIDRLGLLLALAIIAAVLVSCQVPLR
jgi:hypothetical protein